MEEDGSITLLDLAEEKNAYVVVRREYLIKDVGDLLKTPTVLINASEYLSMVSEKISPEIPVLGFKIHRSYVMWCKFPIKPNLDWSYLYGIVLGSQSGYTKGTLKLTVEPSVARYLKKEILKRLKVTYSIEVRRLGNIRIVLHTPVTFILKRWKIDEGIIPKFINIHKAVEGYLNTRALKVRHPEKSEAEIYGPQPLLQQIHNYLSEIEIQSKLSERSIRINGKRNLSKLYESFMIVHPTNGARLIYFEEAKKRKYLFYALKKIPLEYRDIFYFLIWKNKITINTLAKYLHLSQDFVADALDYLKTLRLVDLSPGYFGLQVTYTPDGFKGIVAEEANEKLKAIENILQSQSLEYYVCNVCGKLYSFKKASDMNFKCCGTLMQRIEINTNTLRSLKIAKKKYQNLLESL